MGLFWRRGGLRPPRAVIETGWATATGARHDNQDRCATGAYWAVLSDGIGGHAGGSMAAELAVGAASSALAQSGKPSPRQAPLLVERAVQGANQAVLRAQSQYPGWGRMGATLTLALEGDNGHWLVANVGDSPAWLVRAGCSQRLSEDHNVAADLVRLGVLSEQEAAGHPGRHVLSRGMGVADRAVPSVRSVELCVGDRLVLASDGLGQGLGLARLPLEGLLGPDDGLPAAAEAQVLVRAAIDGGATDNVTAVVIRCVANLGCLTSLATQERPARAG